MHRHDIGGRLSEQCTCALATTLPLRSSLRVGLSAGRSPRRTPRQGAKETNPRRSPMDQLGRGGTARRSNTNKGEGRA
eukprot:CAMPEP_0113572706 /NCGR_PEP_ID=MMETSP0015_2-20120614/26231_1 /TAXON_ID=2838 /ORGANISM="Odontella" /LENGTH=77 /DNA_ID=CAMNT_0000475743 /DNA_START=81 /DNA_END=314 /DNA_ORIENTATION=+ /assembly_acc=CAM_ASM_000160